MEYSCKQCFRAQCWSLTPLVSYAAQGIIAHGGHRGVLALKMRVLNLGSRLQPVARAPARGGVRAWPLLLGYSGSKMLIFAMFYKVFRDDQGHHENVVFPMVFHGFRAGVSHKC
jgi:hypothetical protein